MESEQNENLMIGAYVKRNDPRDVLICNKIKNFNELSKGAKIGSSSRRRELQLKKINKNVSVLNIRGNIDTRIQKLEDQKFDAIVLAAAGVKSLNLEHKIGLIFDTNEIIPAIGQGIIAVQCRKDDFENLKTQNYSNFLKQIIAKEDVWIEIKDEDENILISTILRKDETFNLPSDKEDIIISASNAGALILKGKNSDHSNLGVFGSVLDSVNLNSLITNH